MVVIHAFFFCKIFYTKLCAIFLVILYVLISLILKNMNNLKYPNHSVMVLKLNNFYNLNQTLPKKLLYLSLNILNFFSHLIEAFINPALWPSFSSSRWNQSGCQERGGTANRIMKTCIGQAKSILLLPILSLLVCEICMTDKFKIKLCSWSLLDLKT